jgi:hypothetical protein
MSTRLFQRSFRLVVDRLALRDLDIAFKVKRTLKKEPNTAEIDIYNLHPENRRRIESRKDVRVVLEAGYARPPGVTDPAYAGVSLIFAGDLRSARSFREGGDIVTKISSGDGEKKKQKSRIKATFPPGTSIKKVFEACARAMGVGIGNLSALQRVEFPKAGAVFSGGTVLYGNAADELDGLCRSADLEWSIQNGVLQILTRGEALRDEVIVLSPSTGLIGSPTLSSDGVLHAETLMIPDLFPGRRVQVRSENVSGVFRVETCEYVGNTAGNGDWGVTIESITPKKKKQ